MNHHWVLFRPSSFFSVAFVTQTLLALATLVLAANYKVPLEPVPISLQLLVVLVLGFTLPLGSVLASVGAYVAGSFALGAPFTAGNPLFTGGYLLGYAAAAVMVAYLWARISAVERPALRLAGAGGLALLGVVVVHLLGLAWLHVAMQAANPDQTVAMTFAMGTLPFVAIDLAKAAVAAGIAVAMRRG